MVKLMSEVAFKNVVGARRSSWRVISSIEEKEENSGNAENQARVKAYRESVEAELDKICGELLTLVDDHLLKHATSGEAKVFYYKMKGDYLPYLAEFKSGDARKEVADKALAAY